MTRTIHFVRRNPAAIALLVLALLLLTTLRVQAAENGKILFRPGSGLATINPDGSDEVHFPGGLDARWSPDGRRIAYAGVYVANADGSNPQLITAGPPGEDRNPQWSPDGSKIAFTSNRDGNQEIYVVNVDDKEETRLTNHAAVDARPQWSPDGSKIVFESYRDGNANIYFVDVTSGALTQVTTDPQYDLEPDWSPSGDKIAFGRTGGIFVKELGSGAEQQLTFGATEKPLWSPDGSRIAFIRFIFVAAGLSHRDVYVVNADGSNPVNVAFAVDQNTALGSWSPDGLQVVYRKRNSPAVGIDIYRTVADGSGEFKVTNIFGTPSDPQWGPAFVSVSPPEVIEPADSGPFTELPVHAEGTCADIVTVDWLDSGNNVVAGVNDLCLDGTWESDSGLLDEGDYTLKVCNFGTTICATRGITIDLPDGLQQIKVAVILAEPHGSDFQQVWNDEVSNENYRDRFNRIARDTEDYWCEVSFGTRNGSGECSGGLVDLDIQIFPPSEGAYQLPNQGETESDNDAITEYGPDFPVQMLSITDLDERVFEHPETDNTLSFISDAIRAADPHIVYGDQDITLTVFPGDDEKLPGAVCAQCMRSFARAGAALRLSSASEPGELAKRWIAIGEKYYVGGWAHEIGHTLNLGLERVDVGLPDLYDMPALGDRGLREWSLMSGGFGGGEPTSSTPVHLDGYSKTLLGWLTPREAVSQSYTLESVETLNLNDDQNTLRFDLADGSYYFVEARTDRDIEGLEWNSPNPLFFDADAALVYRVFPLGTSEFNREVIEIADVLPSFIQNPFDFFFKTKLHQVKISASNFQWPGDRMLVDIEVEAENPSQEQVAFMRSSLSVAGSASELGSEDSIPVWSDRVSAAIPDVIERNLWERYPIGWILFGLLWVAAIAGVAIGVRKAKRTQRRSWRYVRVISLILVMALTLYSSLLIWLISQGKSSLGDMSENRQLVQGGLAGHSIPGLSVVAQPDLDLHAYDDQGNHVGVNYETGEYEINIPGAEASGDYLISEEWISVPEGTDVRYEVSRYDIEQFLTENPDIAASLESLEETYAFGAVTYDASSNRYESPVVENITINPGETQSYTIGGTTTSPTVDPEPILVPFETFDIDGVWGDEDDFEIAGEIEIGAASDDFDPTEEGVTLTIGEMTVTIDAEDFDELWNGEIEFDGYVNGHELEMEFSPQGGGAYDFEIEVEDADEVGDVSDPVELTITIGDDTGTTLVTIPEDD